MALTQIAIFRGQEVRRKIHNNEWWFSVVDIVRILTGSTIPRRYWSDLKIQLKKQGYSELYDKIVQLKIKSLDGKMYLTDCANTETTFRIVESIPSPKAEPIKRWLARVGYERVQEIEDPELATRRTRLLYKLKKYPEDWIEKRMRGIAIREQLTDEWQKRGVREDRDYKILTSEISKATFGVTPSQYKKLKGLQRQNLRDHMDDFELIFTMLGERTSTEFHQVRDTKGVKKLRKDAKEAGGVAGRARKDLEKRLGRSVVTKSNFLPRKSS